MATAPRFTARYVPSSFLQSLFNELVELYSLRIVRSIGLKSDYVRNPSKLE